MKEKCPECHGTGYLNHFNHVANGVCFVCMGKGEINGHFQKDGTIYGHAVYELKIWGHDLSPEHKTHRIARIEANSSKEAEDKLHEAIKKSTDTKAKYYRCQPTQILSVEEL